MTNKYNTFNRAKYFSSGIFGSYLVFAPTKKYIKYFSDATRINLWKSNEISEENIENITSRQQFFTNFCWHYMLPGKNSNRHCLTNNNISIPKKVMNLYISYILNPWLRNLKADFTRNILNIHNEKKGYEVMFGLINKTFIGK